MLKLNSKKIVSKLYNYKTAVFNAVKIGFTRLQEANTKWNVVYQWK